MTYEISESTIERYLEKNSDELKKNGYKVLRGTSLKTFKEASGTLTGEGTKTTVLGVFNFRAFLNLGILSKILIKSTPSCLLSSF